MMDIIKLLCAELFGSKSAELNGSNIFSNEYKTFQQWTILNNLFKGDKVIARIPVQGNTIQTFLNASRLANQGGIEVIACLDSYESDSSMMSRLSAIKSGANFVKYFELLNERPHMNDLHPGEKITSLKQLLDLTNKYSDWIHHNVAGGKAITMAVYNSMDERSWGVWDDVTNTRILKELILYTVADIAAIHLYGDSFGKKLQLVALSDNINAWNKEAEYKKKIWVTECGSDSWDNQVKYYDKIIKLFRNTINPEKIIWYRQCVKSNNLQDAGFALEIIDTLQYSPLYTKLLTR